MKVFSIVIVFLLSLHLSTAFLVPRASLSLHFRQTGQSSLYATLTEVLEKISPLGPLRVILVPPGASSILEATVDSSLWGTKINTTPSGKTLLTASLPDKSFELHLDVNIATTATLGKSPKTGGPVVKILDSADAALITLLPAKSKSEQFEDLLTKYGSKIKLDT
ncbi:hypothetical protein TrVE_jg10170 [Triparma verrucosa]|uniref:Uncharacterized protein n=1 Tax=Triparma verrucosa TaxID=1606542 RepID=A0A9W7BBE8_9STRA|nr:hypothetical protein TrVE_jg10170 [Triparma verrucosa]